MTHRDIHMSGDPHASEATWTAAVKDVTARADVVGWSDAGGRDVSPSGWGQTRTRDGCTVAWDKSVFRKRAEGVYSLPVPEYRRGSNRRTSVDVVWALLEDVFGATILRAVEHMPAHVQGGRGYTTAARRKPWVEAHKAALAGHARMLWTLQRDLHPDEWVLSMDANVNMRLKAWRQRFHRAIEPTDLRLVVPPRPTFAKRTIDVHLTTMRATDSETLPKFFGADEHSGTYAVLTARPDKENR